ncbi:MAG TPA: hypothetical protein VFQ18_09340, partial [Candidatus Acidoferrum sp.]|nr:hypothetical protein [Candidatus Acidoferrum sp.]
PNPLVEEVAFFGGSYRVFPGRTNGSTYVMRALADALRQSQGLSEVFLRGACNRVRAVLALSDVTTAASRPRPFAAIFWGGLLAGIFDITQAFIGFGLLGARPFRILQHIAGGILGARSFEMGWTSALLGLVIHFGIAFTAAAVYYLSSRVLRVLVERALLCGLLYGELVFLFMYFVVLPLSALGPAKFNMATYITGPIGHPFLVGLPIALCVRRFAK